MKAFRVGRDQGTTLKERKEGREGNGVRCLIHRSALGVNILIASRDLILVVLNGSVVFYLFICSEGKEAV